MTLSQNRFILCNLPIAVNFPKCEKALYLFCKIKKASYGSFCEDKWFLDSGISTYFTLFESDFVDMTLDNYSQVKTTNSEVLLFIVASGAVLIKHEIFDPEKETTKVAMLKLWLVYYVSDI